MKKLYGGLAICLMCFATSVFAEETVRSHSRSSPDGTVTNNWSFKGNVNPNTGKVGTNYYRHDTTSPYYRGPSSGHGSRH
jgi:hypothetical protein